jgi:transcription initiation factor TFIID TATA-box-binding protein
MSAEIVNVVGMITYRQELDLQALADTFSTLDEISSVTYEPVDNHWLQARFEPDDSYVAFYRSGRCSVAGANSIEHFEEIAQRVTGVMRDLLEFDYEPETEVNNIVTTAELELNTPLEVLAIHLGMESVEYEPEQFPALLFRGTDHTILLFSSGKMVCTGLSDTEKVSKTIEEMKARIQSVQ